MREAEVAVIGAALLETSALSQLVALGLQPEEFSKEHHAVTWRAILDLHEVGKPVDLVTVGAELGSTPDVLTFLHDALTAVPSASNAVEYAELIRKAATARAKERFDNEARSELRGMLVGSAPLHEIEARAHQLAELATTDAPQSDGFSKPRVYTLDDLERDRKRVLLKLGSLPREHGLGAKFDELLGGGLAPGDLVAVGAASAGAGKTALVMQLADGLALRSANLVRDDALGVLTPVLLISEMDPRTLAQRSLARLVRARTATFRAGGDPNSVEYVAARFELCESGDARRLFEWQRTARPMTSGDDFLNDLAKAVASWTAQVGRAHPGRDVWPVVVVDPIQRWQDPRRTEVEALNALVESLDQRADTLGWIVILTSDTNKTTATAKPEEQAGAGLFRGSYKLMHSCDVVLALSTKEGETKLTLMKNRNGPGSGEVQLAWCPAQGLRFAEYQSPSAGMSSLPSFYDERT